jgi:hypothetical protein
MNVSSCVVTPSSIALGGQSNLTVTIDQPAPPGGIGVIIDIDSNGSQDTLVNSPVGLAISTGQTQLSFLLQTSSAASNPATKITFIAHIGPGTRKTADLYIA